MWRAKHTSLSKVCRMILNLYVGWQSGYQFISDEYSSLTICFNGRKSSCFWKIHSCDSNNIQGLFLPQWKRWNWKHGRHTLTLHINMSINFLLVCHFSWLTWPCHLGICTTFVFTHGGCYAEEKIWYSSLYLITVHQGIIRWSSILCRSFRYITNHWNSCTYHY